MQAIDGVMLGSTNGAKIEGVRAAFVDLQEMITAPDLSSLKTWTCEADSGVDEEPWGFPATIEGAQNRARKAYAHCIQMTRRSSAPGTVLGLGVESGFIEVAPHTFTLYNFDVCALYDGRHYFLGISPGFEYPRRLVRNIFLHRQSFQEARQYITSEADIERQRGIIGVLAGGLTERAEMTRLSTRLALIRYLRRQHYARWQ